MDCSSPSKWIIFDLDGTLADSRHRSHHIHLAAGVELTHDDGEKGVITAIDPNHPSGETHYFIEWQDDGVNGWSSHSDAERWRKVDWEAWDADTLSDTVIEPVKSVLAGLRFAYSMDLDVRIMFLTARGERNRILTVKWLTENGILRMGDRLVMRAAGDIRRDTIIKRELIESMRAEGHEFLFAFEDRRLVAKMLRDLGIFVFHVADYD